VPLPYLQDHPLCPVTATLALMAQHALKLATTPLFSIRHPATSLTHGRFEQKLKQCLTSIGLTPDEYSGHSFRRGGASWAFQAGLPGEAIQTLGDWKSQAYLRYLEIDIQQKFQYMNKFTRHLPTYY
jgi:integrase